MMTINDSRSKRCKEIYEETMAEALKNKENKNHSDEGGYFGQSIIMDEINDRIKKYVGIS